MYVPQRKKYYSWLTCFVWHSLQSQQYKRSKNIRPIHLLKFRSSSDQVLNIFRKVYYNVQNFLFIDQWEFSRIRYSILIGNLTGSCCVMLLFCCYCNVTHVLNKICSLSCWWRNIDCNQWRRQWQLCWGNISSATQFTTSHWWCSTVSK